jgi:hypothetical protein
MRLLIALALASCYRPSVQACQYACASSGACPEGLVCQASGNMCVAQRNDTCAVVDGNRVSDVPPTGCTLFATPVPYSTQPTPRGVAIGDINGDAVPDIAVATQGAMSFDSLFGAGGGGTFAAAFSYNVFSPTISVAVIALGSIPVVVAVEQKAGTDGVATYAYVSGTNFMQKGTAGTVAGSVPGPLAIGKFNGDALDDIAVGTTANKDSWTFAGQSDGALGTLTDIPGLAGNTTALAAGDLDNDGRDDLVFGNVASQYQVAIKSQTAATFTLATPVAAAANPTAMVLVDLNRDQKLDLVLAAGTALQVGLGNGDGTFGALASFPIDATPEGIAVGDFDRDGVVDVAVTSSTTDSVTVYEGLGNGNFKNPVIIALDKGAKVWAIAAGDLNADSFDDLVVSYYGKSEIVVLLNTCM